MLVLGITESISMSELSSMASDPVDKNVAIVDRFQQLPLTLDMVRSSLCNSKYSEAHLLVSFNCFVCRCFTSWQHPRSYQDGYRLVGSAHSWRLYSAVSQEHQTTSTMTCYPTQSPYPDTEPTSPCPILIMTSIRLGSDKYQF